MGAVVCYCERRKDRWREYFYLLYGAHDLMLTLWVANQCSIRHPNNVLFGIRGMERSNQHWRWPTYTVGVLVEIARAEHGATGNINAFT